MRKTHEQTAHRRSHHALSEPRLSTCECGAKHMRHHMCGSCGKYKGRVVTDVAAKAQKRAERIAARQAALGAEAATAAEKPQVEESTETVETDTKKAKK